MPPPKQFPLAACSACGGDWFREADYYAFLREEGMYSWPGWPDLTGQASLAPMMVGVCLCGTPLDPLIGGVRGGRTPNLELTRFLESLSGAKGWLQDNHDERPVLQAAEDQLAGPEALQALDQRLTRLQRDLGQRTRSGPGRYWELPVRQADGKRGILTRDALALKLQERGLTFRDARRVVDAIFQCMTDGLKRGETIDVPSVGTFQVKVGPKPHRRFRLGRIQNLYQKAKKVVFKPARDLRSLLAQRTRWIRREAEVPEKKDSQYSCEKCGSTMFAESQFRQYRKMPSSLPGGDLVVVTNGLPIRALVCACGHPVRPGRLRRQVPGDHQSFEKSFAAALQYREGADPEAMIRMLACRFAARRHLDMLAERLAQMEGIIGALPRMLPAGSSRN